MLEQPFRFVKAAEAGTNRIIFKMNSGKLRQVNLYADDYCAVSLELIDTDEADDTAVSGKALIHYEALEKTIDLIWRGRETLSEKLKLRATFQNCTATGNVIMTAHVER